MLIGADEVPGKSESFQIEVEMFNTGNEPPPPFMDSEHGHESVRFGCKVIDADIAHAFAKSDNLKTPYEVADFARTQIQGYFGPNDGDDESDTPQNAPEGEPSLAIA